MEKKYLALFIVILLFVFGCSSAQTSQQSSSDVSGSGQNSVSSGSNQQSSSASGSSGSDSAATELKGFISNKANVQWQINYDVESKASGETYQSTMVQYLKGASKIRTDITASGVEARTYAINGEYTQCTKYNANWNCNKINVPKDQARDADSDINSNDGKYTITSDGTKLWQV